jgi:hypothetical protein
MYSPNTEGERKRGREREREREREAGAVTQKMRCHDEFGENGRKSNAFLTYALFYHF